MTKEQRMQRVVARGEHSNHSHVVTGDVSSIEEKDGNRIVTVGENGAVLKHILETEWVNNGSEVWTKEHKDIPMEKGSYKFVQQTEYDPYEQKIREVRD